MRTILAKTHMWYCLGPYTVAASLRLLIDDIKIFVILESVVFFIILRYDCVEAIVKMNRQISYLSVSLHLAL